ncbi:MAG TPA: NADP-dependent phosphogluconate dehydrogenase [Candidatus Saccharimonadales bacterium]|nr:NADP-dependent phosphogluconate dehydrogenase [Candidatus Saccharimonadales bacterium]
MKIAVQGLGRMGLQIARKLSEDGHSVIAHNRSPEPIAEAARYGATAARSKQEVLAAFGSDAPVILWIMLPADVVDAQVDEWLALIPKGSILIDGGNSDFRLTQKLNQKVKAAGMRLLDVGTSGGVWGYRNGFSMMIGTDDAQAFHMLEPALNTLAAPGGAYHHFGPSGSGHYVKMVHNAIEYGMMESLAEGYRILHEGPYAGLDLAAAGDIWQHHSVITSWLNELSRDALRENPALDGIDGFVAESGEARWTLEVARDKHIPLPSIQAAFDVRLASQKGDVSFATKLLAAMRNKFGGHNLNQDKQ